MALYLHKPPSQRVALPLLVLLTCLSAISLSALYFLRHAREAFIIKQDEFWSVKNVEYDSSQLVSSPSVSDGQNSDLSEDPLAAYLPPEDPYDPIFLPRLKGIAVTTCFIPTYMTSKFTPLELLCPTPKGSGWSKIPKDINSQLESKWGSVWVWTRKEGGGETSEDSRLIERIMVVEEGAEMHNDDFIIEGQEWVKVSPSLRNYLPRSFKLPALNIYYLLSPLPSQQNPYEPITGLDILYGDEEVEPPFGWYDVGEVAGGSIMKLGMVTDGRVGAEPMGNGARLIFRAGYQAPPLAPTLRFSLSGKFSILQVADMHFSTTPFHCRDLSMFETEKWKECIDLGGDGMSIRHVKRFIEKWKQERGAEGQGESLVVLTGDQINGQGTSWDSQSAMLKISNLLYKEGLTWTAVFGNHDDENDLSRLEQMRLMESWPYFAGKVGPLSDNGKVTDMGVGNYLLKVWSSDKTHTNLLNLYFLDSHAYAPKSMFKWWEDTKFDWIKPSQISWMKSLSDSIKPILRPYTPPNLEDGSAFDLDAGDFGIDDWKKGERQGRMAKPNAICFFHIPLLEASDPPDIDEITGEELYFGEQWEGRGSAEYNPGFFHDAIYSQRESGPLSSFSLDSDPHSIPPPEVKIISHGHQHITNFCNRIKGTWICFGGGGSYSGYGLEGVQRGVRAYEIEEWGEKITTWRWLDLNDTDIGDSDGLVRVEERVLVKP